MHDPMSVATVAPNRRAQRPDTIEASITEQARGLWWSIIVITGTTSLGLNITHAIVYKHMADDAVDLSDAGRMVLAIIASVLPVLMAALLCHTFVVDAPWPIRLIVGALFVLGMVMSLSALVELLTPVVGWWRAVGTATVIDVPALLSLIMIERGNRAQQSAERATAERRAGDRRAAEQARREREAAEQRAAEQAAAERLAVEQRAAEEAATARAETERQAAAERAEAERQAAARAENERLAAAERAAAERAETKRLEAERAAAEQATAAEQARAERMAAAERMASVQRDAERERAEREAAERRAEAERKEAERQARAERRALNEQAERGDLAPVQKKAIIRELYLEDRSVKAPAAVAAVAAKGGVISDQRARAVLAEVRQEEGGLAEVRRLRSPAAV